MLLLMINGEQVNHASPKAILLLGMRMLDENAVPRLSVDRIPKLSIQRANCKYKDHRIGQLTREEEDHYDHVTRAWYRQGSALLQAKEEAEIINWNIDRELDPSLSINDETFKKSSELSFVNVKSYNSGIVWSMQYGENSVRPGWNLPQVSNNRMPVVLDSTIWHL